MKRLFVLLLTWVITLPVVSQDSTFQKSVFAPADDFTPWRFGAVTGFHATAYASSVVGFHYLWYKDQPKQPFHWFNDNDQWLGMDKVGHVAAAFRISQTSTNLYLWSGVQQRKAVLAGSLIGFVTTSTVEVFDGFSKGWGASWGDLLSNAIGSGLLYGEYLLDDPYAFNIKFTTHPTEFAPLRPELLGENRFQHIFKDYNGQTYWLSLGLNHLVPIEKIPNWLNIAFGYGAEGMLGGKTNPSLNQQGEPLPTFDRYRQYYLSLDIELRKIKTKSPFLNACLKNFGFIKIPFPALEVSKHGVVFHPLYL